jgi:acetyl-CoA acyltransferase
MREVVIASAVRTPVGKAPRGALHAMRPDDLAAIVIREAGLDPCEVDDVILGCAMPEAEQGLNVARIASLRAGLPVETPGMTVNRFCASGLQAVAMAAERIATGGADVIIAGGTESMSQVPMGGNKISPNPWLMEHYPDVYLNMGLTAENVARKYSIGREEADEFALNSHRKALAAIRDGRFDDEIVAVEVDTVEVSDGHQKTSRISFRMDEGPRADSTREALAKLKPAFHTHGAVTAGNSSQMSDGAAAAVVMSAERACALGAMPLARFVAFAVAGCAPEEMGLGPALAIPKALKQAGLSLEQMAVIELNEAFAAQALAVIRLAGLDASRVNPNGGAIALGHPLGCTGAKLTATLLRELARRNAPPNTGDGSCYGMVAMCIGGGMGAAGIFESLSRDLGHRASMSRRVVSRNDAKENQPPE